MISRGTTSLIKAPNTALAVIVASSNSVQHSPITTMMVTLRDSAGHPSRACTQPPITGLKARPYIASAVKGVVSSK